MSDLVAQASLPSNVKPGDEVEVTIKLPSGHTWTVRGAFARADLNRHYPRPGWDQFILELSKPTSTMEQVALGDGRGLE